MASLNEILTIGNSGLLASKSLLQMAGFNIANANTPGYARRTAQLQAQAVLGMGVSVDDPRAVRNELVSRHLNSTYGDRGFHEGQLSGLNLVQEAFNDLDGVGLGVSFNNFEDALAALAGNPAGATERQAVLNAATALGTSFGSTRSQLQDGQDSTLQQARAVADDVSFKAQQVHGLNQRIKAMTENGRDVGGLVDQRAALISSLSSQMAVQVVHQTDGSVLLYAGGGRPLVGGDGASRVVVSEPSPSTDVPPLQIEISFDKPSGENLVALQDAGGQLGGLVAAQNDVIGPTIRQMDELAFEFARQFNIVHDAGFDFNGTGGAGGAPGSGDFFFFTDPATGAVPIIENFASNLRLSDTVENDPNAIRASSNAADVPGGNLNANIMRDFINQPGLFPGVSAKDVYSGLVLEVASAKQAASVGFEIETGSVTQLETMLESEIGVSVDEELIRMTQANQSFEAASQVIRNADQMSQTILSLLG
ncbi:MAG: flagellar hook-associated protein FlgK [Myxococcota bacterium]|nr:flagellar hook-associated protein FlgK [Myxococcota bacterium]